MVTVPPEIEVEQGKQSARNPERGRLGYARAFYSLRPVHARRFLPQAGQRLIRNEKRPQNTFLKAQMQNF